MDDNNKVNIDVSISVDKMEEAARKFNTIGNKLSTDINNKITKPFNNASKGSDLFSKVLKGVSGSALTLVSGLVAAGASVHAFNKTVSEIVNIDLFSEKTGVMKNRLLELQFLFKALGGSAQDANQIIADISQPRAGVKIQQALAKLQGIGINTSGINVDIGRFGAFKNVNQIFDIISKLQERIQQAQKDGTLRRGSASTIIDNAFGDNRLFNLLLEPRSRQNRLLHEARSAGAFTRANNAEGARRLTEQEALLGVEFSKLTYSLSTLLVPAVLGATKALNFLFGGAESLAHTLNFKIDKPHAIAKPHSKFGTFINWLNRGEFPNTFTNFGSMLPHKTTSHVHGKIDVHFHGDKGFTHKEQMNFSKRVMNYIEKNQGLPVNIRTLSNRENVVRA